MSKSTLKKELVRWNKDELVEIILTVYSASKDTKEYFDFFIDPNPEKLKEKYEELIIKEFSRTKYGNRSKARISLIRQIIKRFISFEPGTDYITDFYYFTICHAVHAEQAVYFSTVLFNGVKKITTDFLTYSDRHCTFTNAYNKLTDLIENQEGTPYMIRLIKEAIEDYTPKIK